MRLKLMHGFFVTIILTAAVTAQSCSTNNENCHPWTGANQEIIYGNDGLLYYTTFVDSTDTDYDNNLFVAGRTQSYKVMYGKTRGSDYYAGYVTRFTSGALAWAKFVYGDNDGDQDTVKKIPWVGLSRKAADHTYSMYLDFVAFYLQRKNSDWLIICDGSNGDFKHLQKIDLGSLTDTMLVTFNSFVFQGLQHNSKNSLTDYRVYIGYSDTTTFAAKKFQLQARSTTTLQKNTDTASSIYGYGCRALAFQAGKVYFGGARNVGSGFRPLIGRADATTLAIEDASYWNAAADGHTDYTMIDKMYSSQDSSNKMIIGLGTDKTTTYTPALFDKFTLVVGRDASASQPWTSVGCWKWSVYRLKDVGSSYKVIDDLVGPLNEAGKSTLYIYLRSWTN